MVVFSLDRADGSCTQRMTLTLRLDRLPTLSALTVTAASADGKKQIVQAAAEGAFSPLQSSYTYQILNTLTSVNVCPTASMAGYTIRVNNTSVTSGQSISVPLNGITTATVTVSGGGYENRYTLTLRPGAGQLATFNTASDVTLRVTNAAGEVLDYDSERNSLTGGKSYFYTLVSGGPIPMWPQKIPIITQRLRSSWKAPPASATSTFQRMRSFKRSRSARAPYMETRRRTRWPRPSRPRCISIPVTVAGL
ncbi:MAG: cadherin-like beta sandwich domain-containing protein [Oscillospiraceae bacterium]